MALLSDSQSDFLSTLLGLDKVPGKVVEMVNGARDATNQVIDRAISGVIDIAHSAERLIEGDDGPTTGQVTQGGIAGGADGTQPMLGGTQDLDAEVAGSAAATADSGSAAAADASAFSTASAAAAAAPVAGGFGEHFQQQFGADPAVQSADGGDAAPAVAPASADGSFAGAAGADPAVGRFVPADPDAPGDGISDRAAALAKSVLDRKADYITEDGQQVNQVIQPLGEGVAEAVDGIGKAAAAIQSISNPEGAQQTRQQAGDWSRQISDDTHAAVAEVQQLTDTAAQDTRQAADAASKAIKSMGDAASSAAGAASSLGGALAGALGGSDS